MRKLNFETAVIANAIICKMLNVKKGDVIAITCDSASNLDVVNALAERAFAEGAKPLVMYTPKFLGRVSLADKSIDKKTFADALSNVDQWIDANAYDFYHSATYEEIMERNPEIRYLLIGNQKTEILYKVFAGYNFDASKELNEKLKEMFSKSKKMRITSAKGTDVEFDINPNYYIMETSVSQLPAGGNTLPATFNFWPDLGSGNGVVVFDRMYEVTPDDIIHSDIYVELKNSKIVRAWGKTPQEDAVAKKFFDDITAWNDENAMKIAHISFGMLPNLNEFLDEIVLDERVWGCIVWGIGNVGPEVAPPVGQVSPYHIDGISQQNSVYWDGEAIMINDKFVHPLLKPITDRLFDI